MKHARKVGGARRISRGGRRTGSVIDTYKVRAWPRDQGIDIKERGQVSADVAAIKLVAFAIRCFLPWKSRKISNWAHIMPAGSSAADAPGGWHLNCPATECPMWQARQK